MLRICPTVHTQNLATISNAQTSTLIRTLYTRRLSAFSENTPIKLTGRSFSYLSFEDSVWVSFADSTCAFFSTRGLRWSGNYTLESLAGKNVLTINDGLDTTTLHIGRKGPHALSAELIGEEIIGQELTTIWNEYFINFDLLQGVWYAKRKLPPPPPLKPLTPVQEEQYVKSDHYKLTFKSNCVYLTDYGYLDSAKFEAPFVTLRNQSNLLSPILGKGYTPSGEKIIFIQTLNDSTLVIDHVNSSYGLSERYKTTFHRNL